MPHLGPQTLTAAEQDELLRVSAAGVRDHLIISVGLGTGLHLGELVGLNAGDVFLPNGSPRIRIRLRAAIAKGGRPGDIFFPDALVHKLRRFRSWKLARMERLTADAPLIDAVKDNIESNSIFDGKTLTPAYKKPFDTLIEGLKDQTGGAGGVFKRTLVGGIRAEINLFEVCGLAA